MVSLPAYTVNYKGNLCDIIIECFAIANTSMIWPLIPTIIKQYVHYELPDLFA